MSLWIRTLDSWGIPLDRLACYIIPKSIESIQPAGLFIRFRHLQDAAPLSLTLPYGMIGNKLFVPIHAEIQPACTLQELDKQLAWEIQVFHPQIGLIGFSHKDEVFFHELLSLPDESQQDWTYAKPGLEEDPPLNHVRIPPPNMDLIQTLRSGMDTKPLDQIPKGEGEDDSEPGILNALGQAGLFGLSAASSILGSLFPTSEDKEEDGILDKLQQWTQRQMEALQDRRNQELSRLLKLFESNPDEALKYALPVDMPYERRGATPPANRLGKRDVRFDLGKLGGGQGTDYWEVDQFYHSLRQKYQEAARKAIQEGDYQKAAYIYAHLLGNYRAAANALKQGKRYREAAILYKEHLKDLSSAASCFEQGGLLLEAIEIYKELNQYEKVGNLYQKLGQRAAANEYFEICVEKELARNNALEAARLLLDKLDDQARAKSVLLEGWQGIKQYDLCLKRYAHLIAQDPEEDLAQHLLTIYQEKTAPSRKTTFLKVLVSLTHRYQESELMRQSREICYEIVSEQAINGDVDHLHLLKNFLPNDRLIRSDIGRYKHLPTHSPLPQTPTPLPENFDPQFFHKLGHGFDWKGLVSCGKQLLVFGTNNQMTILVRINPEGKFENYQWDNAWPIKYLFPISEYPSTSSIFLITDMGLNLSQQSLTRNAHFHHTFTLDTAPWLPKELLGFSIDHASQVSALTQPGNALSISQYSMEGELKRSFDCRLEDLGVGFSLSSTPLSTNMLHRKKQYYFTNNQYLIRSDVHGRMEKIDLHDPVRNICVTPIHSSLQIAVHTTEACFWLQPDLQGFHPIDANGLKTGLEVQDMCFLPANRLAVAGQYQIKVYHSDKRNIYGIGSCRFNDLIHSIFPTDHRDTLGVMTVDGSIYKVRVAL